MFLFLIVAYVAWRIWSFDSTLRVSQVDAAIVLGTAVDGDEPSPVFRERINHAIELYRSGRVGKIVFTGGRGDDEQYAESAVAREYALTRGVKEEDIITEAKSTTTFENLSYALEAAEPHDLKTFAVVSDPLHLKRAMLIAHDMGITAYPSATTTTKYNTWKSKSRFLLRETYFYLRYRIERHF